MPKGDKHHSWRGGITPLTLIIRMSEEYAGWRKQVFTRDNYTCQECNKDNHNIEAHHKKPFAEIFKEFLTQYSQFSPIEDKETLARLAITYQGFWDIENGETLCDDCHKIETYTIKEGAK